MSITQIKVLRTRKEFAHHRPLRCWCDFSLAAMSAFLFGVILVTSVISGRAQDLPYTSSSTGADGPFVVPEPITARSTHAAAFDERRGQLVVFGGSGWENDIAVLSAPNWTFPGATEDVAPSIRQWPRMAYDAVRGEVLLFGGNRFGQGDFADTWTWNGTAWRNATPSAANGPAARSGHSMGYDAARQEVILFGGEYGSETWAWNGELWTQKSPVSSPQWHWDAGSLAYDSTREETILFSSTPSGETWAWDGSTWTEKKPSGSPSARSHHALAYDGAREEVVLFGGHAGRNPFSDTWVWDGENWELKTPRVSPPGRFDHTMTYDPLRNKVVLVAGNGGDGVASLSDTWLWDGEEWTLESAVNYVVDMAEKPDGIWNYTSIHVPEGLWVSFRGNHSNTPVQWLATETVRIDGYVYLNGMSQHEVEPGEAIPGGPGGFDGGMGGTKFLGSGSYAGTPGGGPGGGAGGNEMSESGNDGVYAGSYSNSFLQPLIGGSGGGGGASNDDRDGGNGGGGGGAIFIASSRDIIVNGHITAIGGQPSETFASKGGYGSGGAIRLVADRVIGEGLVDVNGWMEKPGRIRIEGYDRSLAVNANPSASVGPPTETFAGLNNASLTIAEVAGEGVAQSPTGNTANPDVVFLSSGPVTITVTGGNIANGTPITLRITTKTGILTLPREGESPVTMQNNSAIFTTTVPAGVGSIEAYATISGAP